MKTINDIKNAVLSGNRVFWKNDSCEVIKDSKNQWMIAFRRGQSGENYVGLTYRDGVRSDYDPKDFYIKGKSVNMKIEDNFYGKRVVKGIFAKAKFDKSNYYALEGTVDGNATGSKTVETIEEAMYYGKAMLEHMKKQSPKAKVATVHIFKVVNYQRENKPVKVLNSRTGSKAKFGDPVYGKDPVSSASNKVVLKLKGGITATLIRQNGEWSVIEFPNAKTFRNLQVMYQYLSGKANSDKLSELK